MKKLFKLSGDKVIASLKVKSDKTIKGFEEREVEKGEDGLLYLPGTAPALWDLYPAASRNECFKDCTNLENYAAIPDGWK